MRTVLDPKNYLVREVYYPLIFDSAQRDQLQSLLPEGVFKNLRKHGSVFGHYRIVNQTSRICAVLFMWI